LISPHYLLRHWYWFRPAAFASACH
jgi:hypothetical protein